MTRWIAFLILSSLALPIAAQPVKGDMNGDGRADIALQETGIWLFGAASGRLAEWQMNGTAISGALLPDPGRGWLGIDVADFDADGLTDIALQNQNTWEIGVWLMNGNAIKAAAVAGSPAARWDLMCAGDIDNDGKADLILQHRDTAAIAWWKMDGTTVVTGTVLGNGGKHPEAAWPKWRPAMIGDFNGDGFGDLVLVEHSQNPGGFTRGAAIWLTDGNAVTAGRILTTEYIEAVGTADFNGDAKDDIVVDNGQAIWLWLMDGFNVSGSLIAPNSYWDATTIGDYDGDGDSDILLQSGGAFAQWKMNGLAFGSSHVIANNGGNTTRWIALGFYRRCCFR